MIATLESTPNSVEMNISSTGVSVAAVKVKASGSDIKIDRVDLNFNTRPWLYVSGVTVTDGTNSKTVAVSSANSTEITVGSSYTVRVDGLNIVVPKDSSKVLTVKVDAVAGLPGTETSKTITLTFSANAIRGVDGANIQQYAPTSALSRSFTVKSGDTATIELSAAADNPKARNVQVSESAITSADLLKVNVKAKSNDAYLRTVTITLPTSTTDANPASGTVNALYLYDGSTLLASTSSLAYNASAFFEEINLLIPKDTTKTLTVKADINKTVGNYAEGDGFYASLATSGISAEDATTFGTATVSGSTVNSGTAYLYAKAPSLALVSSSITPVSVSTGTISYNGKADAKIRIRVTAQGGDIYIASSTTNDYIATSTYPASASVSQSITTFSGVEDTDAGNYVVRSGNSGDIEIYVQLTRVNDGGGLPEPDITTNVSIAQLKWGTTDTAPASVTQTWGLTDFKTGNVILEGYR